MNEDIQSTVKNGHKYLMIGFLINLILLIILKKAAYILSAIIIGLIMIILLFIGIGETTAILGFTTFIIFLLGLVPYLPGLITLYSIRKEYNHYKAEITAFFIIHLMLCIFITFGIWGLYSF